MKKTIFFIQLALVGVVASIASKVAHAGRAPLESDRNASTRLAWIDRSGTVLDSIDLKGHFIQPRLSATQETVLLTRVEPGRADIWSLSTSSHALRRLTAAKKRSAFPVWDPVSDRYLFSFQGKLLQSAADAKPETLYIRNTPYLDSLHPGNLPEDWSPDGHSIVFSAADNGRPGDLFLLRIGAGVPCRLLDTTARAYEARFSPDGNWIALTSNQTGGNEVYVVAVPREYSRLPLNQKRLIRVSQQGGHSPEWAPNGELLYVGASGDLFTVAHADSGAPDVPHSLFRISSAGLPGYEYRFGGYGIGHNGRDFLVALAARSPVLVGN